MKSTDVLKSERRLGALDALRAVAVFLVIICHLGPPAQDSPAWVRVVFGALQRGGWAGVDLFFVLSGFLVSGLLFAEQKLHGDLHLRLFWVRRGLKIYPSFYVFLLASFFIAGPHYGFESSFIKTFISEALYIQNYGPAFWEHTWSLGVEEHFYILLPVLLWAMGAKRDREKVPYSKLPYIIAAVCLACLSLRVVTSSSLPYSNKTHVFPTHLRLDSLFIGVGLGYAYHYHREKLRVVLQRYRLHILVTSLACFVPAFYFSLPESFFLTTLGLTLLAFGSAGIVGLASLEEARSRDSFLGKLARFIQIIGIHSYSIYLWHMAVLRWGMLFLERRGLFEFLPPNARYLGKLAVFVALSIAVGILVSKLIEKPVLAFRDRYAPSRAKALSVKPSETKKQLHAY